MVVHLLTNSSVIEGGGAFQRAVYGIHSIPPMALLAIEWLFIFLPIIFHAVYGVIIIRSGLPNSGTYRFQSNIRYTFQRATGMIAFLFIAWHVFHMHGWIHAEWWENAIHPLGGASFRPYNAGSTAAMAMQQSIIVPILYLIGVLSCVFHLANGIWTFGITWGLWTTQMAQNRARRFTDGFGIALAVISLTPIIGLYTADPAKLKVGEDKMIKSKIESGEIDPDSPKIYREHESTAEAGK
jgi:succinate dehydrogenase / fumarate reductase cytochrome b subunit